MHLLQFLQKKGFSRRKILDSLLKELVFLNGQKIKNLKENLKVGDRVQYLESEFLVEKQDESEDNQILILFNKPKGVVVSKNDSHNKTIYELLPKEFQNFYYIWRLDRESRGLLLLTNSSKLVHQYEHPRFWITKTYIVLLSTEISSFDLQQMKKGIVDEWEKLSFLDIFSLGGGYYQILLNEGKKRHIRRVIKKLGYHLLDLQRIQEGIWKLWSIEEWKRKKIKISWN